VVNHIEHFLKTHIAELYAEQLIKMEDTGVFSMAACRTDAGDSQIWILGAVIIEREVKHAE
jgi:hypothetical protein